MLLETLCGTSLYGVVKLFQIGIAKRRLKNGDTLSSGESIEQLTGYEKCIQLLAIQQSYDPPVYINTNGSAPGVGIPIGGSITSDYKQIYSVLYGGKDKDRITNYTIDINNVTPDVSFINTAQDYTTFLTNNSFIDKNSFPLLFPLKVQTCTLSSMNLWAANRVGIISNNREFVINHAAINHTFRGWRGIVGIAVACAWVSTGMLCYMTWDKYHNQRMQQYLKYISLPSIREQRD